jgi:hypothetical protein
VNTDPAPEDVLIEPGINDPIAIRLILSLLEEAGVPYVHLDGRAARWSPEQDFRGWLRLRVPAGREQEAREIVRSVQRAG